jgi:hypothetical protein
MKKILTTLCCILLMFSACKKESSEGPEQKYTTDTYSHDVATAWMDMQLKLIKTTPGFTPPVAARALGYSGVALYETVVAGMPDHHSADMVLNYSYTLPVMMSPEDYNWAIAANAAMQRILLQLFANTSDANKASIDSLHDVLFSTFQDGTESAVSARSEDYGETVANIIFDWSKTDNGHEGYNSGFPASYVIPSGPGLWVPTPPAFAPIPLHPYWGENRPFVAKNVTGSCIPPQPITFSDLQGSDFYKQAFEVYEAKQNLTDEQKAIALFWADGGNTVTPPGHNMNIATQMLRKENANLARAAEVYMRMGMAANDAFVACWKGKYQYNVMRPVTYIRQYIAADWLPLIGTPPFPEYGSGHSTGSGAAASVLNSMFGENVSFTDYTHETAGLPARSFNSFNEAAAEAAVSRLYGGIHYRQSNDIALKCGKEIGANIVDLDLSK